ncbi:MAG: cation diffusion facilitator family transporter [Candidatus Symbiothrix sp.]|nr:cation diffusion facilitator family transporter [Candidatus Symbiothrix sp.]
MPKMGKGVAGAKQQVMLRTSWISLIGNTILAVLKVVVGAISGSLAVLSDGLDSTQDVVTSVVMLIATPIIYRKPNTKFVFGQTKAENVASTILSFAIFFMGGQMFLTAINHILQPQEALIPTRIAIWVTLISIAGKLLLALYQFREGKKVDSPLLKANAINMRNDVIISTGVLVGLGLTYFFELPILDAIVALLISIYIIYTSISIFKEANLVLMDGVDDTSVYEKIIEAVEAVPGASNPHRIRSGHVGNLYNIVLDIEADGSISLLESHQIAEAVENSIKSSVKNVYDIVVHVEPTGDASCKEKYGVSKDNLD